MSWADDSVRDSLVRGIAAAQGGDAREARGHLERVLRMDPPLDSRIRALLWLSQVEEDSSRRRAHLEEILAYEPTHPTARRSLAILNGHLRPEEIIDPERVTEHRGASGALAEPVTSQRFVCHRCGGNMRFDPQGRGLVCQYCGQVLPDSESPRCDVSPHDQDFITTLARAEGHLWQQAAYAVSCEGCGATTVLPPSQISQQCPFCGSTQVVHLERDHEVVEPHGIIPFSVPEAAALEHVRSWLSSGWSRPAGLARNATFGKSRAVYVPYWSFDFVGLCKWNALVEEGRNNWVPSSDEMSVLEYHILVPATRSLPAGLLRVLDEFDLQGLELYAPEKIAAWPAELYQIPLADASLLAREIVTTRARHRVTSTSLSGRAFRSLQVQTHQIAIDRFQHILLPVWVFSYRFGDQLYHVLENGQNGEVEGEAPISHWRAFVLVLLAIMVLAVFALLLYLLTRGSG